MTRALAQNNCQVLLSGLLDKYEGECKKGLAHGKGVAYGNGFLYQGLFKKGYPHGKGKIKFEGKQTFIGEFSNGLVKGYGKLYIGDSIVNEGYWKGPINKYKFMGVEKADLDGYAILVKNNLNEASLKFSKSDNNSKTVAVRLSDTKNQSIRGVSIEERTSGQVTNSTFTASRVYLELNNLKFPFTCTLRYSISQSGNLRIPAILRFIIKEEGDWTIRVTH